MPPTVSIYLKPGPTIAPDIIAVIMLIHERKKSSEMIGKHIIPKKLLEERQKSQVNFLFERLTSKRLV